MFAKIISNRIENEPPSSMVIPTCDIRILLLEHAETLEALKKMYSWLGHELSFTEQQEIYAPIARAEAMAGVE